VIIRIMIVNCPTINKLKSGISPLISDKKSRAWSCHLHDRSSLRCKINVGSLAILVHTPVNSSLDSKLSVILWSLGIIEMYVFRFITLFCWWLPFWLVPRYLGPLVRDWALLRFGFGTIAIRWSRSGSAKVHLYFESLFCLLGLFVSHRQHYCTGFKIFDYINPWWKFWVTTRASAMLYQTLGTSSSYQCVHRVYTACGLQLLLLRWSRTCFYICEIGSYIKHHYLIEWRRSSTLDLLLWYKYPWLSGLFFAQS